MSNFKKTRVDLEPKVHALSKKYGSILVGGILVVKFYLENEIDFFIKETNLKKKSKKVYPLLTPWGEQFKLAGPPFSHRI